MTQSLFLHGPKIVQNAFTGSLEKILSKIKKVTKSTQGLYYFVFIMAGVTGFEPVLTVLETEYADNLELLIINIINQF